MPDLTGDKKEPAYAAGSVFVSVFCSMNKLFKMYPEYDISCFGVEEYVMPYCDTEED